MALVTMAASVLVIPLLPVVPPLAEAAWAYLAMSIVIHVGYYATLVATYRHADLSVGYPIMRGSAPLLVTLASLVVLGERPSPAMWTGIALISAGVLSLALGRGGRGAAGRALPY